MLIFIILYTFYIQSQPEPSQTDMENEDDNPPPTLPVVSGSQASTDTPPRMTPPRMTPTPITPPVTSPLPTITSVIRRPAVASSMSPATASTNRCLPLHLPACRLPWYLAAGRLPSYLSTLPKIPFSHFLMVGREHGRGSDRSLRRRMASWL